MKKQKLLFVDDEENILNTIRRNLIFMRNEWECFFALNAKDALEIIDKIDIDLIITDAKMPNMNGGEFLQELQKNEKTKDIPTIMLTGYAENEIRKQALEAGIIEFLLKPIIPEEFILRLKNVLKLKMISDELKVKNEELYKTRLQIIRRLGKAAEYKDNETGLHVIRVAHYSLLLSKLLGLDEELQELIFQAAPMHDIGKIGVPDSILLKPDKLTDEEFSIIKFHPEDGDEILQPLSEEEIKLYHAHTTIGDIIVGEENTPLLRVAGIIAKTHHEKWDGSGYPNNLKGEEIPIEGRIVALADIFDALSTKRHYKPKFPIEKCVEIISELSGNHLQPEIVDLFKKNVDKFIEIQEKFNEN